MNLQKSQFTEEKKLNFINYYFGWNAVSCVIFTHNLRLNMGFEKELKNLIVKVYEDYINKENISTQSDYTNKHRASSTGFCHRKQYYSFLDTNPTEPIKEATNRIFRLGTILHKDIQEAFTKHVKEEKNVPMYVMLSKKENNNASE